MTSEVHSYDGKLTDIKIPKISDKLKQTCYKVFEYILNNNKKIKEANFYQSALLGFHLIKSSTSSNFDSTNNQYADDILCHIIIHAVKNKNMDLFYLTAEQIADMYTSGQCPQGRCTRLLQIYLTISC